MSIRSSLLASSVAIVALLPLSAMAQSSGTGPGANAQQPSQQSQNAAQTNAPIVVMPARQLIGRNLRDPLGRGAGRIDRIVLDTVNGAVDFVVVAGHGDLDLNGAVIAVPWSEIVPPKSAQGPIGIKLSVDKLSQAPRLDPDALATLDEQRTRAGIYGYYGYGRYAGPVPYGCYGYGWRPGYFAGPYQAAGRGSENGQGAGNNANRNNGDIIAQNNAGQNNSSQNNGSSVAQNNAGHNAGGNNGQGNRGNLNKQNVRAGEVSQTGHQLVQHGLVVGPSGVVSAAQSASTTSANALRSAQVFTASGNGIGHIDRVLIDPEHGEVAFVLIKQGGFLGLTPHWYAVPIEALAWTPFRGGYRLTVNKPSLASEPSIPVNENNLPARVDAGQLAQLYQHFDIQPYWEAGAGQQGGAAGSGSSQQSSQSK